MRIRRTRENLSILILGLAIICLLFGIICKQCSLFASAISETSTTTAEEENSAHFVTIYDDGTQNATVHTDARTVGEVIERSGIKIGQYDSVEPDLDEEIKEENFNINIYRTREVVISDGYHKKYVKTAKVDPDEVVTAAGIKLLERDVVKITTEDNILESGMNTVYQVIRAKAINLDFYGTPTTVRTQAQTVGEFLKELGVSLNSAKIWCSRDKADELTDGMAIAVYRQGVQTLTVEEDVPFTEVVTTDYSVDYGVRKITVAGVPGKKIVTYEVVMKDGVVISKTVVSEVIYVAPIAQQVTLGMNLNLPPGAHVDWMIAAGITDPAEQLAASKIIERESHWNPIAQNRTTKAHGLCQAYPGNKMASFGTDWETNPITQLRWCNSYAINRYGSWQAAWAFWQSHRWW